MFERDKPSLVFVTDSFRKIDAFRHAIDNRASVFQINPPINEKEIIYNVSLDHQRASKVAERKLAASLIPVLTSGVIGYLRQFAENDQTRQLELASGRVIQIVTDTIQVVYTPDGTVDFILEKPAPTLDIWMACGMHLAQSERKVGIITAISGIPLPRYPNECVPIPQTVLVTTQAEVGKINESDFIHYVENGGKNTVLETAGGLSLCNGARSFYKDTALTVLYQANNEPAELIHRREDWKSLSTQELLPYVYGTFGVALDRLIQKCSQ